MRRLFEAIVLSVLIWAAVLPAPQSSPGTQVALGAIPTTPTNSESDVQTLREEPVSTKAVDSVAISTPATDPSEVVRIQNPYTTTPRTAEAVNTLLRAATVNILCYAPTNTGLAPISGSGVILSNTGIVLTNAHVGQYLLLADASPIPITCTVRTGSPARAVWKPHLMYISSKWVEEHAADIRIAQPTGTGENDVALLSLTPLADAPDAIPFITPDVREAVTFLDDPVIVSGYPAGFAGNITVGNDLALTTSPTAIKELFTFDENTVDLLSLGGIIVAQSGSSGGGVANMWGYLVGLVSTSSQGEHTSERDLRAITLAHVSRVLIQETGVGLIETLKKDPQAETAHFKEKAHTLASKILAEIER